jgi:hypothetical protein
MTSADTVTVSDAATSIEALAASDFTTLANVDKWDSTDDTLSLTVAQVTAVTNTKLTSGDTVTMSDSGANIATFGTNASNYSNVDAYDATDNALSLTIAQLAAVTNAKLASGDTVTVADSGANIAAASLTTTSSFSNVDAYDATDNALSLTIAQLAAVTNAKLASGDTVTVADSGANIAAASLTTTSSFSNVDAYNASDDALALTLAQVTAVTNAKLTAGDTVTVSLAASDTLAQTTFTSVDKVQLADTNITGVAQTQVSDVDGSGEWFFNNTSDVLTYYDAAGSATASVTLTGYDGSWIGNPTAGLFEL